MFYCNAVGFRDCPLQLLNDRDVTERRLLQLKQALQSSYFEPKKCRKALCLTSWSKQFVLSSSVRRSFQRYSFQWGKLAFSPNRLCARSSALRPLCISFSLLWVPDHLLRVFLSLRNCGGSQWHSWAYCLACPDLETRCIRFLKLEPLLHSCAQMFGLEETDLEHFGTILLLCSSSRSSHGRNLLLLRTNSNRLGGVDVWGRVEW